MNGHPARLYLPNGIEAELIPGSQPSRYAGVDVDVTIPDDLARAGWHWHGTFLSDGEVGIYSGTFGVPGVFEEARRHMRLRATVTIDAPVQLELWAA